MTTNRKTVSLKNHKYKVWLLKKALASYKDRCATQQWSIENQAGLHKAEVEALRAKLAEKPVTFAPSEPSLPTGMMVLCCCPHCRKGFSVRLE